MGVGLVATLWKLLSLLLDMWKKTPQEKRREAIKDFNAAIDKADKKSDLRDLSKWFGERL